MVYGFWKKGSVLPLHVNNEKFLGAYIEKPIYPKRVAVWCEFWSRVIIELFFFGKEQGVAVTLLAHVQRIFVYKNYSGGYGQCSVLTGRPYVPH